MFVALLNGGGGIGQRRHGARPTGVPTWMVERGEVGRHAYDLHARGPDFGQAGTLVRDVLDDAERDSTVSNIVGHVSQDVSDDVQGRMIGTGLASTPTSARVATGLGCGAGQHAA